MTGHTEWLNTKQAAAHARRCEDTIRDAAQCGDLHGHQPGGRRGRWVFKPEAVDAWMTGRDGASACGCQRLKVVGRRAAA